MTRQLVFVHGRSQQMLDPAQLKKDWIGSLKDGLRKSHLELPIGDDQIRFPYYGDTLHQLDQGLPPGDVAKVIVKGTAGNEQEAEFVRKVVLEMQDKLGITDEQVQALDGEPVEKGVLNWGWVQRVLEIADTHVPHASSKSVALATRDVHRYLSNPGIRQMINQGVSRAMTSEVETVVVAHSLGTVVMYNLLKGEGGQKQWKVPLFVTLGSPLAVRAIKEAVAPRKHPSCVAKWFNAMDHRDVVALYPLDEHHFSTNPAIENKTDIENETENRHGISGYLSDPVVARRIYDALTAV